MRAKFTLSAMTVVMRGDGQLMFSSLASRAVLA
jgi:hypothetical protein